MGIVTLILAAVLLVVPVVLVVNLLRKRFPTKVDWLIAAITSGAFVGYVVLVGRWDLYGYYLRVLLVVALLVAVGVSVARVWRAPWWRSPDSWRGWLGLSASVLVGALFVGLLGWAAAGLGTGGARPAELAFPLRDGVSYVGQGGGGTVLNYHHPNRAQAFATDIVALNPAGLHAWGLSPSEPGRYAVFDRAVHSPCTGRVLETRDGLADLNPPATDRENLAGNHVVLRCAGTDPGVDVLLAHLRQGSVAVEPGTQVQVGQVVGRVGNTGNTSEPHLHVHAVRTGSGSVLTGEGVPIRFDGRFLVRNSLVVS